MLAVEADGLEVTTVEGLAGADGRLSPLQAAFLDKGAVQCGFCIPGQLVAAHALLDEHPHPSRAEIEEGLAGQPLPVRLLRADLRGGRGGRGRRGRRARRRVSQRVAANAGARSVEEGLDQ